MQHNGNSNSNQNSDVRIKYTVSDMLHCIRLHHRRVTQAQNQQPDDKRPKTQKIYNSQHSTANVTGRHHSLTLLAAKKNSRDKLLHFNNCLAHYLQHDAMQKCSQCRRSVSVSLSVRLTSD